MRASSCIHVYTYTPIHVYMYLRPHEYILKEEDQDIIKGGREGKWRTMLWASALLDEWTCSSGKLIKWESLASHLLSLWDTACRFVGTFRLRDFALTSSSADITAKSIRWNSSSILHGVGRSIIILLIKMQIYKDLLLIMVWGFQGVFMCTRTHLSMYICIHVHMNTF